MLRFSPTKAAVYAANLKKKTLIANNGGSGSSGNVVGGVSCIICGHYKIDDD